MGGPPKASVEPPPFQSPPQRWLAAGQPPRPRRVPGGRPGLQSPRRRPAAVLDAAARRRRLPGHLVQRLPLPGPAVRAPRRRAVQRRPLEGQHRPVRDGVDAALCSVGYFAWVGIVFASVPKVQFPSFVAQNGPAFSAATYTHFIAFVTALLGTETRVWAEHPFWVAGAPWSSRLIGFAGLAGLIIFLYGALTLINVFSATICNDNGFDGHIWPGLAESTNVTLQRHQALVEKEQEKQTQQQVQQQQELEKAQDEHRIGDKVNCSQRISVVSSPQADLLALINGMRADEVAAWLQTDKRLAVLGDVARKECIEGSALLEMVHMTAAEASAYYVTLFPSCPRGLGIVLWRMIRSSSSSSSTPRQGGLAPRRSTIGRSTSQLDSTSRAALGMGK